MGTPARRQSGRPKKPESEKKERRTAWCLKYGNSNISHPSTAFHIIPVVQNALAVTATKKQITNHTGNSYYKWIFWTAAEKVET